MSKRKISLRPISDFEEPGTKIIDMMAPGNGIIVSNHKRWGPKVRWHRGAEHHITKRQRSKMFYGKHRYQVST